MLPMSKHWIDMLVLLCLTVHINAGRQRDTQMTNHLSLSCHIQDYKHICERAPNGFAYDNGCQMCYCHRSDGHCPSKPCRWRRRNLLESLNYLDRICGRIYMTNLRRLAYIQRNKSRNTPQVIRYRITKLLRRINFQLKQKEITRQLKDSGKTYRELNLIRKNLHLKSHRKDIDFLKRIESRLHQIRRRLDLLKYRNMLARRVEHMQRQVHRMEKTPKKKRRSSWYSRYKFYTAVLKNYTRRLQHMNLLNKRKKQNESPHGKHSKPNYGENVRSKNGRSPNLQRGNHSRLQNIRHQKSRLTNRPQLKKKNYTKSGHIKNVNNKHSITKHKIGYKKEQDRILAVINRNIYRLNKYLVRVSSLPEAKILKEELNKIKKLLKKKRSPKKALVFLKKADRNLKIFLQMELLLFEKLHKIKMIESSRKQLESIKHKKGFFNKINKVRIQMKIKRWNIQLKSIKEKLKHLHKAYNMKL